MFEKLYGQMKDRESLGSVLDEVRDDLRTIAAHARPAREGPARPARHLRPRNGDRNCSRPAPPNLLFPPPALEPGVDLDNDGIPKISTMQTDLLVNALANDMARVATLQYTNSVGQARMRWLGIDEGHHGLSHEPDDNADAQEKLVKINTWFCEQLAYLAKKLDAIPEPGGDGTMLDHTTIVWTNELGKGNSHTLDNIPFVLARRRPRLQDGPGACSSTTSPTTASGSPSPTPSATTSPPSASRNSATAARWPCREAVRPDGRW